MKARAPGKVVLSGAYAVLEGAPALVTAVDRYVTADGDQRPQFLTPEVEQAVGADGACAFDASALREDGRKLGLGSSAAILVASLAARRGTPDSTDAELRDLVLSDALIAHRAAQGGGSGIDVACAAWGGTIRAERSAAGLAVCAVALPAKVHLEVWASGVPATTSELVGRVRAAAADDSAQYAELIAQLTMWARAAAAAAVDADADALIAALDGQSNGLLTLGRFARAPIVTAAVERLAQAARTERATVLPAGAGGGDICLFAGLAPPSAALRALAAAQSHTPLTLRHSARGVHRATA